MGQLITDKPLLAVSTDKEKKSAVFFGDGLWQWRLEEYNLTKKTEIFDELFLKLIQYLSSKVDNRKLKLSPSIEQFTDNEKITFDVEVYNDIYEKIYGQPINLEIINDKGKVTPFVFTNAEGVPKFEINSLPKGVYKYRGYTKLKGKIETSAGEFIVKNTQLELLNTTADFNLLKNLAKKNQGHFYNSNEIDLLAEKILSNPPSDLIQTNESMMEIINLKWIFILIIILLGVEWGLRKYLGAL